MNIKKNSFWSQWGLLFVLSGAILIMVLDSSLMNVSISALVKDLDTDVKSIQWLITLYSLIMASFMITGGRLGDIFGRKKIFLIGVVLYGIGTITAALAPNVPILLLGWSVIEGIAAALMMPATLSLVLDNYRGKNRMIAFGVWGGMASAGAAVGPLLGGYMTSHYTWRWAFGIEAVIVVLILLFAGVIKSHHQKDRTDEKLDLIGVLLSVLGLGTLIYGIIEASTYGWWKAKEIFKIGSWEIDLGDLSISPVFMLIGALILVGFYFWERKMRKEKKDPLINFELFKNKNFTSGITTLTSLGLLLAGVILAIPLFLQMIQNMDAYDTGVALLPMSIGIFIMSAMGAKLGQKIPGKYLIQFGIILIAGSIYLLNINLDVNTDGSDLIWGLGLCGIGMGLVMSQISNITLSTLKTKQFGEASGFMTTIRTFGGALGTAIIGTIFLSSFLANFEDNVKDSSVLSEEMKTVVIEELDNSEQSLKSNEDQTIEGLPESIVTEMQDLKTEAGVSATKESLYYGAAFTLLTFLVSFWLPKRGEELDLEGLE